MRHRIVFTMPMRWLMTLSLITALVMCLISSQLAAHTQMRQESVMSQAEIVYVPSLNQSKLVYLGYNQTAADVLWVRTLNYFARHFTTDRKYPFLTSFIDQIIELDPKFQNVYWWAGSSLLFGRFRTNKVVMEANEYYERALKEFPNDHESAYRLGMNYHSELQSDDPEIKKGFRTKALFYLEQAAGMPDAPRRLGELVAALNIKYGADELALQYLTDLYLRTVDPKELKQLEIRMKALNKDADGDARRQALSRYRNEWMAQLPYSSDVFFSLVQDQIKTTPSWWKAHFSLPQINSESVSGAEEQK